MAKAAKKSPVKTAKKRAASPALKPAQKAKAKAANKAASKAAKKPQASKPVTKKAAPKAKPAPLGAGLMTEGKVHGVRPDPKQEHVEQAFATATPVPSFEKSAAALSHVIRVPFSKLRENPRNYRQTYDDNAIKELADSIAAEGLLQNLVTFPADGAGLYVVNSGNRRYRALQLLLKQKKIDKDYLVHILPKKMDEAEALALAIVENLQRKDVDALEEAEGFKRLVELKWPTTQIAEAVGLSLRTVQDRLQLATGLFKAACEALKAKKISIDQARAIVTAPVSQLQDKLLAFATRSYQPGTAEQLRAMLKNECAPLSRAIFDPKLYNGPFVGDGKGALFADHDKFMALQMEAARAKAVELGKTWKAAKVFGPADGYFGIWSFKKEADPKKGGAMVEVTKDGKVNIHEGWIDKVATGDDIFAENIPAEYDDDDDDNEDDEDESAEAIETPEARERRQAELAQRLAEARAATRNAAEAIESTAIINPHFALRIAIFGIVAQVRFPFTDIYFYQGAPISAVTALMEAAGGPTLTPDEDGNIVNFEPIVDLDDALRFWEALVALPDSKIAKLFAQFIVGNYVEAASDEKASNLFRFGPLDQAVFAQTAFDLPDCLKDEETDDDIDEALDDEGLADFLAEQDGSAEFAEDGAALDPFARDAAEESGELAEDEEVA